RPELRKKFAGKPEQVVAYFTWIAEDVRRILAELGCQTLDEIIGRAELLERVDHPEVPRAQMLDLSVLLADPVAGHDAPRRRTVARNDRLGVDSLDEQILTTLGPRLEGGRPFAGVYDIGNHHLTVGARIAGRIAERAGNVGLAPGSIRLRFRGSAGQSFGAFALPGMRLELEGEANEYVAKGLPGRWGAILPPGCRTAWPTCSTRRGPSRPAATATWSRCGRSSRQMRRWCSGWCGSISGRRAAREPG